MSYWRLRYHFTWGTKGRVPCIEARFEADLHNILAAKAKELEAFVYAVGGIEDHIHLVVSVPPKISLASFVAQVKGNSSHWLNHGAGFEGHFEWQHEYGVVSFGVQNLDTVVRYVGNQREHHHAGTCIPGLERVEGSPEVPEMTQQLGRR